MAACDGLIGKSVMVENELQTAVLSSINLVSRK